MQTSKRFALAALACLIAAPAPAQFLARPGAPQPGAPLLGPTITSVPSGGFVPPAVSPGVYPGYFSSYYDPFGGYFRGVGDLVGAYGRYGIDNNTARLLNQQVEQEKIRTRRMIQDQRRYEQSLLPTAEEIRERDRQIALRRAMNDPPLPDILSATALNTLLQNIQRSVSQGGSGPAVPLDAAMLERIHVTSGTGGSVAAFRNGNRLQWPLALRDEPFDADRDKFQMLVQDVLRQVEGDNVRASTVREMTAAIDSMERTLNAQARNMDMLQIIEVRRYLGELRDGTRALGNPSAPNYFNKRWRAQGRDVAELVQHMTREGLSFAPAVAGDEGAYRSLHQAMVAFNYGATQARR